MISAKKMSEAIRMKRKKVKDDGVENMLDTAPGPQMNPTDILETKERSHIEDITDAPTKSSAPSDPADEDLSGTSQHTDELKRRMARTKKVFDKLG